MFFFCCCFFWLFGIGFDSLYHFKQVKFFGFSGGVRGVNWGFKKKIHNGLLPKKKRCLASLETELGRSMEKG